MILTAPTREDCERVRLWRNEDISGLRTSYLLTKEMQEDFYDNVICDRNSNHRYWTISSDDGKFIGFGGITNIQWENRIGEISLIINPKYRESGCGKEAVDLILNEAFRNMNLNTVCGECYMMGGRHEFWKSALGDSNTYFTELPKRKYWKGHYYDSLYFSISRGRDAK